jgi:hypothetical protein
MELRPWRWGERGIGDPVRGVFKVATWYDPHPHWSSGRRFRLTGVVSSDGVPATPVDHLADWNGKWVAQDELPVVLDRANPANFRILWREVTKPDWKADARQRAARMAEQMSSGEPDKVERPATYVYTDDHERATAVVVAVDKVSSRSASAPAGMFDLTLDVVRDHGPGFTLRARLGFSTEEKRARVATVGARLPVVIDPADQGSVTLDLDALGF